MCNHHQGAVFGSPLFHLCCVLLKLPTIIQVANNLWITRNAMQVQGGNSFCWVMQWFDVSALGIPDEVDGLLGHRRGSENEVQGPVLPFEPQS